MKRIQEKVKDVIEVLPYKSLQDFITDPAQTLSAYHFTDVTSELMAKWLDRTASVQNNQGAANALAGYRGVGKSHFLATLGAIAAHPELRSRISDPHAEASAQRLKRVRYPVAYVRRGTHETLLEEFKDGVGKALDIPIFSNSISEILISASEKFSDLPFILIIDTAFERSSRVSRDDGVLLGEIAEIAKDLNIFVAVALDDDIAGADGINAAIARNFSIDYLDQEHLYRIVESDIFPKHRQMRPLLHDIYTNLREVLPNFRWSEQRFTSLYPLHPVILETAPSVRLYAPEFALLGFASEAGARILGRPANSLIALDEVFDLVENSLRKVEDLKETFATYEKINSQVITQIPVMQRLRAKLILKGLFLLSLEGDGTTAGEISAAMLIYDEFEPEKAIKNVEELLEKFVSAVPDEIQRSVESGREIRYSLKVSGKDNLNRALAEASKNISTDVISEILQRVGREKFSDWSTGEIPDSNVINCGIVWRGGLRRGRVFWNFDIIGSSVENSPADGKDAEFIDWEVFINDSYKNAESAGDEISKIKWQPAKLREDEINAILRYYVLLTDQNLREQYGEQIRSAGHAHQITVEKIWNRIFLNDGALIIEGFDYNFVEEARTAHTLSGIFNAMLEPYFEGKYPDHPYFAQTLDMDEVAALVNDFFSGARQNLVEVQQLAEVFALPLGLVTKRENTVVVESEENLVNSPMARIILNLIEENPETAVSLNQIYKKLRKPPYGLPREAQHLILTALVAQRQIEFVTSKGDRINRRSLDLKIIWDDIAGVAKPSSNLYADARLAEWVQILTGANHIQNIDNPAERENTKQVLAEWLLDWDSGEVLERFNALPDEILNTKIWRLATRSEKSFGAVAEIVKRVEEDSISLEEGLHRIADTFSDSEKEFFSCTKDLVVLEDFIKGAARREEIGQYMAVCETTEDEKIEYFREKLFFLIEESTNNPNEAINQEIENMWTSFHRRFSEHFAVKHDLLMKSHHLRERFDEILRGDEWWEFENLSQLPIFQKNFRREAMKINRQLKDLNCRFDVSEMLKTHPFCACSFNLAKIREWEKLPQTLDETVSRGRKSYRKILRLLAATIVPLIEHLAEKSGAEFTEPAQNLVTKLAEETEMPLFANDELIILQKVFEILPTAPIVEMNLPVDNDFTGSEELRRRFEHWLDELPGELVVLKV